MSTKRLRCADNIFLVLCRVVFTNSIYMELVASSKCPFLNQQRNLLRHKKASTLINDLSCLTEPVFTMDPMHDVSSNFSDNSLATERIMSTMNAASNITSDHVHSAANNNVTGNDVHDGVGESEEDVPMTFPQRVSSFVVG
jgi:hypothetical protein